MRYKSKTSAAVRPDPGADEELIQDLAHFRYALRRFLRFSENAARGSGVTPQQHQLMLGVAGFTGRGSATVSELAEFLQERPHSVLGLIDRATESGLVRRMQDQTDRRVVNVMLTARGRDILAKLSQLHQQEARRVQVLLSERRGRKRATDNDHTAPSRRRASAAAQNSSLA